MTRGTAVVRRRSLWSSGRATPIVESTVATARLACVGFATDGRRHFGQPGPMTKNLTRPESDHSTEEMSPRGGARDRVGTVRRAAGALSVGALAAAGLLLVAPTGAY